MKKISLALIFLGGASCIGLAAPSNPSAEMLRAKEIIESKCILCHSTEPELPFYSKIPGVSKEINKHVEVGTQIADLKKLFEMGGADEVLLAKLEQSIKLNTMPIPSYLALHWNGRLKNAEKEDLLKWIKQVRLEKFSTGLASAEFANHPIQPLPSTWPHELDANKVELGNLLYHDVRLSGDNSLSCAGCHELGKGGTDHAQFSTGVRGQVGGINAPTTFNSAFNVLQFWDGRADDLVAQAGGPPLNPIEMDGNWEKIAAKLAKDSKLTKLHSTVYGSDTWSDKTITEAIAEFEKTLITPNSAVDKFLKGDSNALNEKEQLGWKLFNEHSCATCHSGKAMGGQSFEKAVDPKAYFAHRGITPGDPDMGRFNATKNETDRYKQKVPMLRNIAITGPYLHDGNLTELTEVIQIMNSYFVPERNREKLSKEDAENIAAMLLKNTGTLFGEQL